MNRKILFLTTHNLATNPRLVKEMRLALENGFSVQLICFEFDNWSKANNEILKKEFLTVKIISIPAGRKPFLPWLLSAANEQIGRKLAFLSRSTKMLANGVSRRNWLIIKSLKKVEKPDWVIGHNPGALYATQYAAQKFHCKAGFDVEDYHPGEGNNHRMQKVIKALMRKVLPKMDYVSFASKQIMKAVEADVTNESNNWFVVLNFFPVAEFLRPAKIYSGPVKLVWFSQNISYGRGLELVLPFLNSSTDIELHLIGNKDADFFEREINEIQNVIVHNPVGQKALHHSLSNFDIGLALEPAKDRNNELAISNKILAYFQAGLFVIATNTPAQEDIINRFPDHGLCFDCNKKNFGDIIKEVLQSIKSIREKRQIRFTSFRNECWEVESLQLIKAWNRTKKYRDQSNN